VCLLHSNGGEEAEGRQAQLQAPRPYQDPSVALTHGADTSGARMDGWRLHSHFFWAAGFPAVSARRAEYKNALARPNPQVSAFLSYSTTNTRIPHCALALNLFAIALDRSNVCTTHGPNRARFHSPRVSTFLHHERRTSRGASGCCCCKHASATTPGHPSTIRSDARLRCKLVW
jgi:hypothetical protein